MTRRTSSLGVLVTRSKDGGQISLSSPYTAVCTCEINFKERRTFHKHADARTDDCISASLCVRCQLWQAFFFPHSCSGINERGKSCMCVRLRVWRRSQTPLCNTDQNINCVILKAVIHHPLTYVLGEVRVICRSWWSFCVSAKVKAWYYERVSVSSEPEWRKHNGRILNLNQKKCRLRGVCLLQLLKTVSINLLALQPGYSCSLRPSCWAEKVHIFRTRVL